MDNRDLEAWGRRAAKWSADYLESLRDRRVRPTTRPGEVMDSLPSAPPQQAEPVEQVFADFERLVVPHVTNWQHPRFFAYFPSNTSPPSILAEWLTATMAAQCMLWQTSPAGTELEIHVLDWLRQMTGIGEGWRHHPDGRRHGDAVGHPDRTRKGMTGPARRPACPDSRYCGSIPPARRIHRSRPSSCPGSGARIWCRWRPTPTGRWTRPLQAAIADRAAGMRPAQCAVCLAAPGLAPATA